MFAFGMPGPFEMMIILVVVLLLFGSRLPSVMRGMGQGVFEFKKGLKEGDQEAQSETNIAQKDD